MIPGSIPARVLMATAPGPAEDAVGGALSRAGYEVVRTGGLVEAMGMLARQKFDASVFALGPGEAKAPDVVSALLRAEPRLAVILLVERADTRGAVAALHAGASDYLDNPEPNLVLEAVRAALGRREARLREVEVSRALGEEVAGLTAALLREQDRVQHLSVATLESLVCVVEATDVWLAGHSLRVAEMAACLATEQGRSDADIEQVRLAGRVHDIGMIGLGEGIISKHGPLTPAEFEQVKRHVVIGSQILAPLPQLGPISGFVRSHHERWDGQGYPDGLAGEAIPWGARLIGAAEIYDALTTARPYREPLSPDEAVAYMGRLVDNMIAPAVYQALRGVVEQRLALVFLDDSGSEARSHGAGLREAELATTSTTGRIIPETGKLFPAR